jgi:hypothetical protein
MQQLGLCFAKAGHGSSTYGLVAPIATRRCVDLGFDRETQPLKHSTTLWAFNPGAE